MKKIFCTILCFMMVLGLCACSGGDISQVKTHTVASELYTEEEINDAIAVIEKDFKSSWSGCTLKEIYYAGDEVSQAEQDYAERNDADQVLVLLSTFDVDESGGDGSLNPNSTYEGYSWILVRSDGGKWQHVDHGY